MRYQQVLGVIELDLTATGGSGSYTYSWDREVGGSWTFDTTNVNSLILSGLTAGTSYQWRVKGICDSAGTNTSSWTATQSFTTAICNISLSSSVTRMLYVMEVQMDRLI